MLDRMFNVRARFKPVPWSDLKADQVFYYYLKRDRPCDQTAMGPFLMMNPATCLARNAQGVEIRLGTIQQNTQPMIMIEVETIKPRSQEK